MKKFLRIVSLLLICTLFGFAMVACGNEDIEHNGENENPGGDTTPSITTDSNVAVYEFEFGQITATIKNVEGTVMWTSADPTIATVDENGRVYGVKSGITEISATLGELKSVCAVAVSPARYEHKVALSSEAVSLTVKGSTTVNVSVSYNDAEIEKSAVSGIEYENSTKYSISLNENNDLTINAYGAFDDTVELIINVRGYEVRKNIKLTITDENNLLEPDDNELPWVK